MLEGRFSFRQQRTYLHSTSVFDFLVSAAAQEPVKAISFVFNRRTDRNPLFSETPPTGDRQLIGHWKDADRSLYIYEGNVPIVEHEGYDEDAVASVCTFDGPSAYAPAERAGYSFIEICVAAFKRLLQQQFPDGAAKYAFARITLDYIPDAAFAIRYARKVAGQFHQGDIIAGERTIGRIFFGEWA